MILPWKFWSRPGRLCSLWEAALEIMPFGRLGWVFSPTHSNTMTETIQVGTGKNELKLEHFCEHWRFYLVKMGIQPTRYWDILWTNGIYDQLELSKYCNQRMGGSQTGMVNESSLGGVFHTSVFQVMFSKGTLPTNHHMLISCMAIAILFVMWS